MGSAPCVTIARVEVDDHLRGGVCLVWDGDDAGAGQTCWSAEQGGSVVRREIRLTAAGTYHVWVVAGKILSNAVTVEVR